MARRGSAWSKRADGMDETSRFDRFFSTHEPRVRGLARKYVGSLELAEDITQETMVRAYRAGLHVQSGRDPWPWLASVAHNLAVDCLRSRVHDVEVRPNDWAEQCIAPGADPADVMQARRRQQGVADALGALRDGQRKVLIARYAGGQTCQEIAQEAGLSVAAVKSLLMRGRRAFRVHFDILAERQGLQVGIPLAVLRRWRERRFGLRIHTASEAGNIVARMSPVLEFGVGAAVMAGLALPGSAPSAPDVFAGREAHQVAAQAIAPEPAQDADSVSSSGAVSEGDAPRRESAGLVGETPTESRGPSVQLAVESEPDRAGAQADRGIDVDGDDNHDYEGTTSFDLDCVPDLGEGPAAPVCDELARIVTAPSVRR